MSLLDNIKEFFNPNVSIRFSDLWREYQTEIYQLTSGYESLKLKFDRKEDEEFLRNSKSFIDRYIKSKERRGRNVNSRFNEGKLPYKLKKSFLEGRDLLIDLKALNRLDGDYGFFIEYVISKNYPYSLAELFYKESNVLVKDMIVQIYQINLFNLKKEGIGLSKNL